MNKQLFAERDDILTNSLLKFVYISKGKIVGIMRYIKQETG